MTDRQPQYPGRVLITPEDGSTPYYATLALADEPLADGTPLNAANLFSDAAATAVQTATGQAVEVPSAGFVALSDALENKQGKLTFPLSAANGGTGQTTAPLALHALIAACSALTSSTLATGDYFGVEDVSANTGKRVTLGNLAAFMQANYDFGITEMPNNVIWGANDRTVLNDDGYKLLKLNSTKFLLTAGDEGRFYFSQGDFITVGLYHVVKFAWVTGNPLGLSSAHTLSSFPASTDDIWACLSCGSCLQISSGGNYAHFYKTCYISGENRTYFLLANTEGAVTGEPTGCMPFYIDTTL